MPKIMMNIALTVCVFIWCIKQAAFETCKLDRNEHNKYPWVLRLVVNKKIIAHAILITPKYIVTANQPVKHMVVNKRELAKLEVVGQVYGPGGEMECSAVRKAKKLAPVEFDNKIVDEAVGFLAQPFDVSSNNPYIYSDITYYNKDKFNEIVAEIIDFECCVVPLFNSRTDEKPKIIEHKVAYLKGPTDAYWRTVLCRDSAECHKKTNHRNFFVYDPDASKTTEKDLSWHKGAGIVCNGDPIAIEESQIVDPYTSAKVTMFQHIKNLVKYFYKHALEEWPRPELANNDTGNSRTSRAASEEGKNAKNKGNENNIDRRHRALKNGYTRASNHLSSNILAIMMAKLANRME